MRGEWPLAPGRPRAGRPGALYWALALAGVVAASCGRAGPQKRRLALGSDTVELAPGVGVADVRLGGPDSARQAQPESVEVHPGDVVRFVTADARTHAVAFDAAGLAPEARGFLDRTGQLRGPPLISTGASWVVSLEGAPPGRYPFVCLSEGCRGVIVVSSAAAR